MYNNLHKMSPMLSFNEEVGKIKRRERPDSFKCLETSYWLYSSIHNVKNGNKHTQKRSMQHFVLFCFQKQYSTALSAVEEDQSKGET